MTSISYSFQLCVHVLCGCAVRQLKLKKDTKSDEADGNTLSSSSASVDEHWHYLKEPQVIHNMKKIFQHVCRFGSVKITRTSYLICILISKLPLWCYSLLMWAPLEHLPYRTKLCQAKLFVGRNFRHQTKNLSPSTDWKFCPTKVKVSLVELQVNLKGKQFI